MSTKTPNDGSLQTTKQMLDELDALMDRMLSLPVNELEDAPEMPPVLSAKLTILDLPPAPAELPQKVAAARPASPEPMSEPPPHTPPLNPPHFTPPPGLAEAPLAEAKPSYITPPLPEPEPFTNEVEPPSVMPKLEPMLAALPQSSAAPAVSLAWCYLPLMWLNQMFDRLALGLPAGGWLRRQGGRMLLGAAGIVMTATAVGWLLKDWLGWNR